MNQNQNEHNQSKENIKSSEKITSVDYYIASIPWLKSLIWPLLIIILVLLFKTPINESLVKLSSIIANATTLKYKSVIFTLEEELAAKASEDIYKALIGLSDEALSTLIRSGKTPDSKYANLGVLDHGVTNCSLTEEELLEYHKDNFELENRGLIVIENIEYKDCSVKLYWKWTELGLESHKVFMDILITEITDELIRKN